MAFSVFYPAFEGTAMKVLVIGGTGLMSTFIVQRLLDRGDDVTVFNRGVSEKRFVGTVTEIHGDRFQYTAFEAEMAKHRFDAVIDMVAYHPDNAFSILRAFQGRVKHIVVCSTVCVYGGPLTRLPANDDEPHRPVGDYGRNKSKIERILLESNGQRGTSTTVLRPSYTTGEGVNLSGLFFDDSTVDRLRKGLPVLLMDDGKADWAIAHPLDVSLGFVNALLNPKAYGQAYHLTGNEYTTWKGVFEKMAEAAGGTFRTASIPTDFLYAAAPRRSVGVRFIYQYPSIFDNSKAEKDLGFKTTVPLVETFRRQIKWMEEKRRIVKAEEEPFTDAMLAAYKRGVSDLQGKAVDFNPWGNGTTN
jgi:nucleoside-diphosphate-sugar epimerase